MHFRVIKLIHVLITRTVLCLVLATEKQFFFGNFTSGNRFWFHLFGGNRLRNSLGSLLAAAAVASEDYDRTAAELAAAAAATGGDAAAAATAAAYAQHGVDAAAGGDEGQTGPIRGAYSARSEHGGHVWRPY